MGKLCRTIETRYVEEIASELRMFGDLTEFVNKWEIIFDQVPSEDENTFVYRFPKEQKQNDNDYYDDYYDSDYQRYTPYEPLTVDLKFKEELIDQAIFTFRERDWDTGIINQNVISLRV